MSEFVKTSEGEWAQRTQIEGATVAVPVDLQGSVLPDSEALPTKSISKTIQTHNAVSVPINSWSAGAWIDTASYSEIAVTLKNDATTSSSASISWSHDGVNEHGADLSTDFLPPGTNIVRAKATSTKARYAKVNLQNADTVAAHTMSAWAYLKG